MKYRTAIILSLGGFVSGFNLVVGCWNWEVGRLEIAYICWMIALVVGVAVIEEIVKRGRA